MSLLTVFTSTFPSITYLFPNGKAAPFINGVYKTDKIDEIVHLNREIELGHPHISVPLAEHERVVDSVTADPMVALKERMRQELIAEMAATNPDRDMGFSEQDKFKIQTTSDVRQNTDVNVGSSFKDRLAAMRGGSAAAPFSTPAGTAPVPSSPVNEEGNSVNVTGRSSLPQVTTQRSNPPVIVPLDTSNPSNLPSDNPNSDYLNKKE